MVGMVTFPWTLDEAEARGFRVQHKDGLTLVTASREKTKWQYDPDDPFANDSELVWRSALLDENLNAVSLGFPKFFNYGEWGHEALDQKVERSIADGTALLTAKEDGTLIIRSVYQGRVIWRTRNSFDLGPFEKPVMELVNATQHLSDPTCWDYSHLLFEYVAPQNQIVISYPHPQLVFLGARLFHGLFSYTFSDDEGWQSLGITPVRTMKMSAREPVGIQKEITELEQAGLWDCEGIVVRTPDGIMCKIKGSEYLNAFRMRYYFKYGDFAALCLANKCECLEHAKEVCLSNGVDWEVLTCAEEWWNEFWKRSEAHDLDWIWATVKVSDWKAAHKGYSRAEFAKWVKANADNQYRATLAFAAYDDNKDKWFKVKTKIRDKVIFAPVTMEYKNPWFSLQEEA